MNTEEFVEKLNGVSGRLRNLISGSLKPDDVDDVYQDVVTDAWQGSEEFQGKSGFFTWITRIATNRIYKHRSEHVTERLTLELHDRMDESVDVEEKAARTLRVEMIHTALQKLEARDRTALTLYYIDGLSLRETAIRMDVTETNMSTILNRARERMKEQLPIHLEYERRGI